MHVHAWVTCVGSEQNAATDVIVAVARFMNTVACVRSSAECDQLETAHRAGVRLKAYGLLLIATAPVWIPAP